MPTVRTGKGTKLEIDVGVDPTEDWKTLQLATVIRMTRGENEEIDQTTLLDTARVVGSGLPGVKTIEVSGYFDPGDAEHKRWFEAAEAGTTYPSRVTWPNGTTWTFDGVVTNFSPSSNSYSENMTFDAVVKISGAITWTNP